MTTPSDLPFQMPKPHGPLDRLIAWSVDRRMAQERSPIENPELWVKVNRYMLFRHLTIFALVLVMMFGVRDMSWWSWAAFVGLVFFAAQGAHRWAGGGRAYATGFFDGRRELLLSLHRAREEGMDIEEWWEMEAMRGHALLLRTYTQD